VRFIVGHSLCHSASKWAACLCTSSPYQTFKITFRFASLQRRPHLGAERVHLGQQARQRNPSTRRRRVGRRIRLLESKRGKRVRFLNPRTHFSKAIDGPTRIAISRVTNLIKVLAGHFVPLSDVILLEAYEWAVENDVEVKDLTQPDVCEALILTVGTKG
jgi:hypothetical protein